VNVLSLFSGVGGIDLGLERAGHRTVAFCEIDPKCREVLAHHWPDVPIHEDVTTFDPEEYRGRVDLVAGGSPCQDLSVAGRRAGLDGERSGLFWHQCRIADAVAARWVLWENVAGALTSNNGADFAAVLWGLTGTLPDVPDGGWRSSGVVVGPKRTAVWRLLDARWFGVPQRRRRVFVVAGAGTECGPEILFEPESSPRNPQPSRTSRQDVAALTSTGVGTCGADDNQAQAGHLIPTVAGTLGGGTPDCGPRTDPDRMTFIPFVKAKRASSDTDDETWVEGCVAPTLNSFDNGHDTRATVVVPTSFAENQRAEVVEAPYVRSLTNGGGKPGQGYPAVDIPSAFSAGNSQKARSIAFTEDGTPPLRASSSGTNQVPTVHTHAAVRRLTPLECERLMGWPDHWTAVGVNGPIADSHRYRMAGNGVVANCTEWIGRRLPTV
jgi:DNA (cytosine-5)-methyltransferase 1